MHSSRQQIAILDFGSQYSHLIARRVRELNVFCELYSCQVKAETLAANNIKGIILSGGPSSVYDPESPHVDDSVWTFIKEKKLPVLGICYGMQEIAHTFGGTVSPSTDREFGRATVTKSTQHTAAADLLFKGVEQSQMWMSHGDKVTVMPEGFLKIASSENSDHAAIACPEKNLFGIQFHPEVTHSLHGKELLKNFVVGVCHAPTDWNMKDIANAFIKEVQEKVGPDGHVIGAVSGGVDRYVTRHDIPYNLPIQPMNIISDTSYPYALPNTSYPYALSDISYPYTLKHILSIYALFSGISYPYALSDISYAYTLEHNLSIYARFSDTSMHVKTSYPYTLLL